MRANIIAWQRAGAEMLYRLSRGEVRVGQFLIGWGERTQRMGATDIAGISERADG